MTLLKIARMGNPVLIKPAAVVADPSRSTIRILVENMVETMEDAVGVGLAAPQVYQGKRVIIFKSPRERGDEIGLETDFSPLTTLINPEYKPIEKDKEIGWEGCLSIPGLSGLVPRYRYIQYHGYLPSGERVEREATNFHARVVQHEIDHLDGILFPMRMKDLSLLSFNEELANFNNHINSTTRESGTN